MPPKDFGWRIKKRNKKINKLMKKLRTAKRNKDERQVYEIVREGLVITSLTQWTMKVPY